MVRCLGVREDLDEWGLGNRDAESVRRAKNGI